MATIKEPTSNNPLHAALSLLDAAAYCDDASVAVEEIKVILKDNFASTQAIRKIHSILILLSKALPLISNSVKGQVVSCAPANSNPSYVRSRLKDSYPDGILVLPIEGLSVGGIDPDCLSLIHI